MFNNVQEVIEYLEGRKKKDMSYLDAKKWEEGYSDGLNEALVALKTMREGDN